MIIMRKHIYADNAATTKLDIDAFEAMKPYLLDEYGNPSQPYSFSRLPKKSIQEAREIILHLVVQKVIIGRSKGLHYHVRKTSGLLPLQLNITLY